jgi:hypothetical protein
VEQEGPGEQGAGERQRGPTDHRGSPPPARLDVTSGEANIEEERQAVDAAEGVEAVDAIKG